MRCSCGAIRQNKSWYRAVLEESEGEHSNAVCPACQRMADRNPAGIVTLYGNFIIDHQAEIDHLLETVSTHESMRNPLCRVMETTREDHSMIVTTTSTKLAQKIGRVFFKTYGGHLYYNWAHGEELVRVAWSRDLEP